MATHRRRLRRQQITLRTNVDSAAQVEIPVQGTVGSTLAISGFGWDEQTGVLTLGTVAVGKGAERKLHVVARGPHTGQVRLKPLRIIPDLLRVDIGPRRPLGDGSVVQIPWTVRIPPDNRLPCATRADVSRPVPDGPRRRQEWTFVAAIATHSCLASRISSLFHWASAVRLTPIRGNQISQLDSLPEMFDDGRGFAEVDRGIPRE